MDAKKVEQPARKGDPVGNTSPSDEQPDKKESKKPASASGGAGGGLMTQVSKGC